METAVGHAPDVDLRFARVANAAGRRLGAGPVSTEGCCSADGRAFFVAIPHSTYPVRHAARSDVIAFSGPACVLRWLVAERGCVFTCGGLDGPQAEAGRTEPEVHRRGAVAARQALLSNEVPVVAPRAGRREWPTRVFASACLRRRGHV